MFPFHTTYFQGPRQQSFLRSYFDVEVSFASFANISSDSAELTRDLSSFVKEGIEGAISMEQYPHSSITVHIKVLQCGSSIHSLLSPSIVATGAALKEAGIRMNDKIIALPIAISKSGDYILDAPDSVCLSCPTATIGLSVDSRQMTVFHMTGIVASIDMIDSLISVVDGSVNTLSTLIDRSTK